MLLSSTSISCPLLRIMSAGLELKCTLEIKCTFLPERCLFSINVHHVHLWHTFNFDGTFKGASVLRDKCFWIPNMNDSAVADQRFCSRSKTLSILDNKVVLSWTLELGTNNVLNFSTNPVNHPFAMWNGRKFPRERPAVL